MSEIIFKFSEDVKEFLRKPIGKIFKSIDDALSIAKNKKIICVGDIVFLSLISRNVYPKVSIIDLKTRRNKMISLSNDVLKNFKIFRARNPPSTVTKDLYEKIREALKYERSIVIVDGEEDLAVIPCLMLCDESYVIFYGQPDEGVVVVEINEETIEKLASILMISRII